MTPPHVAGPVPVALVFPAGTAPAGTFTYVAPTVASVTPDQGPTSGGTTVTITGTGFTGATGVTFDGQPGTGLVVSPSGTSLTVTTPPGSVGPADVVVEVPGQNATDPGGFTYVAAAPTIGSLDPNQGPTGGGTTVTVTGNGFVPGQTSVSICGRQIPAGSVTVDPSGLSLTFLTPPCQAGSTTVTVTTPAGTSNGLTFRYVGGSLPVTGTPIALYLAAGLLMLGAGSASLILARHHR
ncbi:MAG TPA: IPT/TIG domain-containing protein [Rugosimonospora sp.]